MVSGEAAHQARLAPGTRYLPLNKRGEPYADPIFAGNPAIANPGDTHAGTIAFTENRTRAYIVSESKTQRYFREYEAHPAVIELPARAKALARAAEGAVVFNPTIKVGASPNKQWPIEQWRELVARNADVRWLQIGGGPAIAERVPTGDIFDAFGVISGALAVVCHEGALHHGAAALGVPAVVIRGGYIGPRVTGYAGQADLFVHDERYPLGCGMRVPCTHCARAMETIKPDDVIAALRTILEPVAA